jgi:hypothetical protein
MTEVDFGTYVWGSLLPHFHPLTSVDSNTMALAITDLTTGMGNWSTNGEFRREVGFLHESTHYLQDLTTGAGHWDYLAQRNGVPDVLAAARARLTPDDLLPITKDEATEAIVEDFRKQLIVPANRRIEVSRAASSARQLRDVFGGRVRSLADDLLTPRRVLEAEAVATVVWHVQSLRLEQDQQEILEDNRSTWQPTAMSEDYGHLFLTVHDTIAEHLASIRHQRPRIWRWE